ncbi:redoxin domain-containing protein [Sphingobacterium sp. DR205]|uniref:redoxin domain-containing protein n=1 Tax=Sphingobacterium sp. DR205 TaxID=2713573 RepID=UPI0013E511A2|nr:redoxin domain-containing protein [Sphingobacterium sp. DR205]QIH32881.1 redoxin domain-containing protein [Sphingobacterium sp. DR205]
MNTSNKFIALMAVMMTSLTVSAQKKFVINGLAPELNGKYVHLSYGTGNDNQIKDSVVVANGKFKFTGAVAGPTFGYISLGGQALSFDNIFSVVLEPTTMKMTLDPDSINKSILTGSKENDKLKSLDEQKAPINKAMEPLRAEYQKRNEEYAKASKTLKEMEKKVEAMKIDNYAFRDKFEPFQKQQEAIDRDFIAKNPQSIVSAYLMRFKISGMTLTEAEKVYNTFTSDVKKSSYGKELLNEINKMRSGSPGNPAYVFSKSDIDGNPLSLADYRGKYVLLDFWASWCVPCRQGNPHLISVYNKYKDAGFEIIGISDDDRNEAAWKKAVEQDQIQIWKHVLRGLKMENNVIDRSQDISEHYGIHTLPTKILIDPQGIIIGRYGSGGGSDADLDAKLNAIFSK